MSLSTVLEITIASVTVLAFIVALGRTYFDLKQISEGERKSNERIAQAESKFEKEAEKTGPAWELARHTLDAYFSRNLTQITSIYRLSVSVLLAGFAIIIWGVFYAVKEPKIVAPASLAILAGVITEFIGATFLFVYRSTIQQAVGYSKTLERINSVGMAVQILNTMPNQVARDDLKSKTTALLVETLVKQPHSDSITQERKQEVGRARTRRRTSKKPTSKKPKPKNSESPTS
jgi:hypothetical protein